ncbi:uncharacterized protein OCT59_024244 [Rhizophagus irregularis]|uniref:uncharacterized protein n=1 Tax=Rhizophagus irregularis TaxID=588596 RepID=UPI00331F05B5|nr:hypothetical protein OCT59_024244 [Rhizophagus irregularis]
MLVRRNDHHLGRIAEPCTAPSAKLCDKINDHTGRSTCEKLFFPARYKARRGMWKFSQLSAKNFPVKITQKISKMSSKFTQADKIKKYETERLIKEFGMGLRPALELEDYIKKLYDRKARVNLGDFLVKK